mgnify:FL=1
MVGDPTDVATSAIGDARMHAYGLGVAQGRDNEVGDGAFYVVLLLGQTR